MYVHFRSIIIDHKYQYSYYASPWDMEIVHNYLSCFPYIIRIQFYMTIDTL